MIITKGDIDHDRSSELPNRSKELFIIQLVFLIIAGVCTLIRAHIKIFLVKCVTTDDYLILSAMVISPHFTFYWAYVKLNIIYTDRLCGIWRNIVGRYTKWSNRQTQLADQRTLRGG